MLGIRRWIRGLALRQDRRLLLEVIELGRFASAQFDTAVRLGLPTGAAAHAAFASLIVVEVPRAQHLLEGVEAGRELTPRMHRHFRALKKDLQAWVRAFGAGSALARKMLAR